MKKLLLILLLIIPFFAVCQDDDDFDKDEFYDSYNFLGFSADGFVAYELISFGQDEFGDNWRESELNIQDLKIVENFSIQENEEFEVEESENTISILNRYIDEAEFDCDKTIIKGILQKVYSQACEVE